MISFLPEQANKAFRYDNELWIVFHWRWLWLRCRWSNLNCELLRFSFILLALSIVTIHIALQYITRADRIYRFFYYRQMNENSLALCFSEENGSYIFLTKAGRLMLFDINRVHRYVCLRLFLLHCRRHQFLHVELEHFFPPFLSQRLFSDDNVKLNGTLWHYRNLDGT